MMESHRDNNDYDYTDILRQLNSGTNPISIDSKSEASDQVNGSQKSKRSQYTRTN